MYNRYIQRMRKLPFDEPTCFIDKLSFVLDILPEDRDTILYQLEDLLDSQKFSLQGTRGIPYLYKHNYSLPLPAHKDEYGTVSDASMFISLVPIKNRNAGFIRFEYTPSKLSKESRKIIRRFLIKLLGKEIAFRIYYEARVTRYDVTVDFPGLTLDDIWVIPSRARHFEIFYGKDGVKETIYYGSTESDTFTKTYDKARELCDGDFVNTKSYPDRTRLEICVKPDNVTLATLLDSDNPFRKVEVYRAMTESKYFDCCFYAACKPAGFFVALKGYGKNEQRRMKRHVRKNAVKLIDADKIWKNSKATLTSAINLLKPKNHGE